MLPLHVDLNSFLHESTALSLLTAVDFIRCNVVSTVVASVADVGRVDAASVGAGEVYCRVAGGEGAAPLVAVVTAVVGVVTDVAHRDAATVVAGEVQR